MTRFGRTSIALLAALAAPGCNPALQPGCNPPCAGNTTCDQNSGTCVPNMAAPDLSVAIDMAKACNGSCVPPTPYCDKDQKCVACLKDENCPIGQICRVSQLGTACVPGCADDSRCRQRGGDGGAGGPSCCGNQCVDTASDIANCGGCGKGCSAPHASSSCTGGACMQGACDRGWGDCNGDPKDGCESNLHVDPMNCTACKMACSVKNGIPGCSDGCYIAACNFGFDDCNMDATDGCETPTLSDPNNCGGCGNGCGKPPHAKASCVSAQCGLSSCDPGFADCNGQVMDGCEVAVATDANNCGKCGFACQKGLICVNGGCTCPNCNFPNAKSKCVNNQCMLDSCIPGFADCDGNPANGCEININFDPRNCGACGKQCPMNMPGCNMGTCSTGCLNGMQPPQACFNGMDPQTSSTFTVCQADCTQAWLASTQQGGGKYHIQEICQSLGYSKYGQFGGTCGNVCGYCQNGVSCMNLGKMNFDGGGMNCGQDMFGPILCFTVMWTCLK